jgi:hypothetical protein
MTRRETMGRYIEARELLEAAQLLQAAADPSFLKKAHLTETELAAQFNNAKSQFEQAERCLTRLGMEAALE